MMTFDQFCALRGYDPAAAVAAVSFSIYCEGCRLAASWS